MTPTPNDNLRMSLETDFGETIWIQPAHVTRSWVNDVVEGALPTECVDALSAAMGRTIRGVRLLGDDRSVLAVYLSDGYTLAFSDHADAHNVVERSGAFESVQEVDDIRGGRLEDIEVYETRNTRDDLPFGHVQVGTAVRICTLDRTDTNIFLYTTFQGYGVMGQSDLTVTAVQLPEDMSRDRAKPQLLLTGPAS